MAAKRERTYSEIVKSYNPDLRLQYFDRYREGVTRKVFDEPIEARCYVICEQSSSAMGGTKHKVINANIEAIERVLDGGELLFRCTCNPEDHSVLANDEKTARQYKKSFFHRLERMMVEVV